MGIKDMLSWPLSEEDVFGTESRAETVSKLTGSQKALDKRLGELLEANIGRGATPLTKPLVADMPSLFTQAYKGLSDMLGEYGQARREALMQDVAGTPAWAFDPHGTKKEWQQSFAIPVMETWRETVLPMLKESYNAIPGGFYSAARGRGTEGAAGRFYRESVMPSYWDAWQADVGRAFTSTEAAAARRPGAVAQLTAMPRQEFDIFASAAERMRAARQVPISARLAEEQRLMPEADPWLRLGLGYLGIPMTEVVGFQGTEGLLQGLVKAGAAAAASGAMGGF